MAGNFPVRFFIFIDYTCKESLLFFVMFISEMTSFKFIISYRCLSVPSNSFELLNAGFSARLWIMSDSYLTLKLDNTFFFFFLCSSTEQENQKLVQFISDFISRPLKTITGEFLFCYASCILWMLIISYLCCCVCSSQMLFLFSAMNILNSFI